MESKLCIGLAASLIVAACGGAPARVSDGWAVASGPSGAAFVNQGQPTEGAPLVASAPNKSECLPDPTVRSILGEVCDHESENRAPSPPTADLQPGIPPPTPEVRWYCDGRFVVRVVLERCDSTGNGNLDGVRPLEIAVATHPKTP